MITRLLLAGFLAAAGIGAAAQTAPAADPPVSAAPAPYTGPVVYAASIKSTYPHDPEAFTQGLLWHDGALYESTGREGHSRVRKVELATGKVLLDSPIPPEQFGEGLALWGDSLISLTWRNGVVHRWNLSDLSPTGSVETFPFEGWGLATSEEGLIHSDGSATLRVLDPETYAVRRTIDVTLNGRPLSQLNELEFIGGKVFANIWQTPYIAIIDPATGAVRGLVDCRELVETVGTRDFSAVLNGIAWDDEGKRLFVTGKLWPSLYEIELVETDAQVR